MLPALKGRPHSIEPSWSTLKTTLCAHASRTLATLDGALPEFLNTIIAQDGKGWFRHAATRNNHQPFKPMRNLLWCAEINPTISSR